MEYKKARWNMTLGLGQDAKNDHNLRPKCSKTFQPSAQMPKPKYVLFSLA